MTGPSSANWWRYYIIGLYNRVAENHLFVFASGVSFSILLSLIPFVLVAFSILGFLVDSGSVQDQIESYISALIPYEDIASSALTFAGRSIEEFIAFKGIAGALGALGLLFIASGLFSNMKTVLNKIYGVSSGEHPLLSALKDIALVVLVILFLLVMALALPGLEAVQSVALRGMTLDWPILEVLGSGIFYAVSLLIAFFVFYLLYRFVPSRVIDHRRAFTSAIVATALWELAKQAFGIYLAHFATLTQVYGAYVFIVVSAVWLYYSSLVFIVSAEVAQLAAERGETRWARLRNYFRSRRYDSFRKN